MKNIEVEAKYILDENKYKEILEYLEKNNYEENDEKQHDIYFSPTHFPFLGGKIDNECLRIRVLDDKNVLSYKKFVAKTEDKSSYCIEHEIEIEDVDGLKKILNDLRIEESITIKKFRRSFNVEDVLEISLDDVDNLGKFIEIEVKNEQAMDRAVAIMSELAEKFKLTDDMRDYEGYSYLLYERLKNKKGVNVE